MKQTVDLHDFREGFRQVRPNNFSYEGLEVLFEYLEGVEDDIGEQLEFDVIALCCDFSEDDWQTIAKYYDGVFLEDGAEDEENMEHVIEFLRDEGAYIGRTKTTIIYRDI